MIFGHREQKNDRYAPYDSPNQLCFRGPNEEIVINGFRRRDELRMENAQDRRVSPVRETLASTRPMIRTMLEKSHPSLRHSNPNRDRKQVLHCPNALHRLYPRSSIDREVRSKRIVCFFTCKRTRRSSSSISFAKKSTPMVRLCRSMN